MADLVFPERNSLREDYDKFFPARVSVVRKLEERIEEIVAPLSSQLWVKGRIKSFESYFKKYIRLLKNAPSVSGPSSVPGSGGVEPPKIDDVIGIRVICPFLEDLAAAEELLKEKFKIVEAERKGGDHTFREFGYESIHLLVEVPEDLLGKGETFCCRIAEIQIRTILQDAWAEAEHEIFYKAEFVPFDNPLKRKLAAINASLSLADIVFQETRSYLRLLNGELGKRRDSFFRKIEESTDGILFPDPSDSPDPPVSQAESASMESGEETELQSESIWVPAEDPETVSIDELLVHALTAHNKNQFSEAIAIYTRILDMKPDEEVRSLIYKHRGMAYFARSHYEEAIADFAESLILDPVSYKAAYYEGIVCSVLKRYPQAVDAYSRSLEINPYQPYCLFRRGQAFYHLEDYPQALGDCEAALALEPSEAARKFKDLLLDRLKM